MGRHRACVPTPLSLAGSLSFIRGRSRTSLTVHYVYGNSLFLQSLCPLPRGGTRFTRLLFTKGFIVHRLRHITFTVTVHFCRACVPTQLALAGSLSFIRGHSRTSLTVHYVYGNSSFLQSLCALPRGHSFCSFTFYERLYCTSLTAL